jgi:hypothetical protein
VKSRLVRGRAFLKSLLAGSRPGSRTKALSGMELFLTEEAR